MLRFFARAFRPAIGLVLVAGTPYVASAQVTRPFDATGTSSFTISAGADTYLQVFQNGNFVQQTFAAVGLPTVSALAFDLQYYTSLVIASPFSFDVLLNGTNVGSIAFPAPNNPGPGTFIRAADSRSVFFAPVAAVGNAYTVRLQQTSATITAGLGSIAFDNNAAGGPQTTVTFNPTVVPEPATLMLVGGGLLGVAGLLRRRRD